MKLMLLIFIVACLAAISIVDYNGQTKYVHRLMVAMFVFVVAYIAVIYIEQSQPEPNVYYIVEE